METAPRILITGATGAIGFEILKQFKEKGYLQHVSVLARDSKRNRKKLSEFGNLKIHFGDITDLIAVRKAVRNNDVVIHLAGIIPTVERANKHLIDKVNIRGTENVIQAMEKECPEAFLLFSSSVTVYGDRIDNPYISVGDPLNGVNQDNYARTKVVAEREIQSSKLGWSIFRLTAIMGVGNHKVDPLMFEMPLETALEFASLRDTARAFVHAINQRDTLEGQIYNLSGGEACRISFGEFLQKAFYCFGLGKLNFPKHAFAFQNFHCGFYNDGDVLEEILQFRSDTTESYFDRFCGGVSTVQRYVTMPFARFVKRYLLSLSEPYKAFRKKDKERMNYYFGES